MPAQRFGCTLSATIHDAAERADKLDCWKILKSRVVLGRAGRNASSVLFEPHAYATGLHYWDVKIRACFVELVEPKTHFRFSILET